MTHLRTHFTLVFSTRTGHCQIGACAEAQDDTRTACTVDDVAAAVVTATRTAARTNDSAYAAIVSISTTAAIQGRTDFGDVDRLRYDEQGG